MAFDKSQLPTCNAVHSALLTRDKAVRADFAAADSKLQTQHDNNSRRIDALYALGEGQAWSMETVTETHNPVYPPTGAHLAGVDKLGGKSVVWNQLVTYKIATATKNGITFTNNSDGSYTVTGTATANASLNIALIASTYVSGHVMLYHSNVAYADDAVFFCPNGYGAVATSEYGNKSKLFNYASNGCLVVKEGVTVNTTIWPVIVDLTVMFGSGNEPTSTGDQRIAWIEAYAAAHPEYNAG